MIISEQAAELHKMLMFSEAAYEVVKISAF